MPDAKDKGKTKGYSLWLMPSGSVRAKMLRIIGRLAKDYCGPAFEPHVTLLGQFELKESEMLRITAELSEKLKSFRITLGKVECSEHHFRCLFVRAFETSELMVANQKAREIFKRKGGPRYMPHLSLFYGRLPPKTKKELVSGMRDNFSGAVFETKTMRLMRTHGRPAEWRKVKNFRLG